MGDQLGRTVRIASRRARRLPAHPFMILSKESEVNALDCTFIYKMSLEPQDRCGWRETSLGRFERDVDEVEQFYASMAKLYEGTGRSYFAITGYLEVSLKPVPLVEFEDVEKRVDSAFRSAWSRLRNTLPSLHTSSMICQRKGA